MLRRLVMFSALAFSSVCFADKLALDISAKDLFVKGSFAFHPGQSIKISGKDTSGKPYEVEVLSKKLQDDAIQFTCRLAREERKQSVSVITKKGLEGSVASGPEKGLPDLKFGANWTE